MILVTGSSGFIGSRLALDLCKLGEEVIGVDSCTSYYSTNLKKQRTDYLRSNTNARLEIVDLSNLSDLKKLFKKYSITSVIHLAAQPGVRLNTSKFDIYNRDNLLAFANILQVSLESKVENFLYASSSSVYGNNSKIPFVEKELNLQPTSYYGATKLSNEILTKSVSKYSTTKIRGLRFFTVYGPSGRPDMAYFKLINNALYKTKFDLYGDGSKIRDFTYVADISTSIIALKQQIKNEPEGFNDLVNISGGEPKSINHLITEIEKLTSSKIEINKADNDSLDMQQTIADRTYLESLIGILPSTSLIEGLQETINWHRLNETLMREF